VDKGAAQLKDPASLKGTAILTTDGEAATNDMILVAGLRRGVNDA